MARKRQERQKTQGDIDYVLKIVRDKVYGKVSMLTENLPSFANPVQPQSNLI